MIRLLLAVGSAVAAIAWLSPATAQSDEPRAPLRVLSSNGVRVAIESLRSDCERSAGRALDIKYGTSASMLGRAGIGVGVRVDGRQFDIRSAAAAARALVGCLAEPSATSAFASKGLQR